MPAIVILTRKVEDMEQRKAKCSRYGMFTGIWNIGILGLVL